MQTESKGQAEPVDDSGKKDNPRNRRAEVHLDSPGAPVTPVAPGLKPPNPPQGAPKVSGDFCTQFPNLCVTPQPQPVKPSVPPDIFKPLPPTPKGAQPKSALDVLNQKVLDPVVRAATKGLPKDVQDKAVDLTHAAVAKGIMSGLGAALGAWGVDSKGQAAIQAAVEAAIKEKGGGSQ
jgi:hypothetical protein